MRPRFLFLVSAVVRVATVLSLTFASPLSLVRAEAPAAPASGPVITATKVDRVVVGGPEANPGDTIRYTVTISNTGDAAASDVVFNDALPAGLSLVSGSLNTSPIAFDQSVTTNEDTPLPITLGATDADGNPLSLSIVTPPSQGSLSGSLPNVTYTPNANYSGSDSFTFRANDGKVNSNQVGTVSITVNAVDDAPVAVNDTATVTEDAAATAVNVLSNDTDVDGGPKSISSVTQPANGTVVITGGGTGLTYAPNANYCNAPPGTTLDTFIYTLTPGGSSATVSMTVTCVDDAPVAVNDSATVTEDAAATAVNVLSNDTDIDGGPKSISSVTQPANGAVVITGGGTGLTYQPNANYCNAPPGTTLDTFTYTLTPGGSSATVSMTVTCVDDAPVAVNDSATVTEDAAATAINVLSNDTDVDGGPKSIASVTQPTNGTVVITGGGTGLTYAPNANYCNNPPGTTLDTFTYTLNGGSTGTVSVTVTCVDDNPVAVNDSATVTEDAAATAINVLANDTDVDGGPKSISSVTQPTNGTVVITGGGTGLTYAPNANYCNSTPAKTLTPPTGDTFTYTLTPGGSSATVTVTVTCVDDNPVAVNDSATVTEDAAATAINVLSNDTDIDGGPKSISSVTQPTNGAVVITGGGTGLTYQPNANYCNAPPGTTLDTFTYTLTPGGSSATVSVTVNCVNDAPAIDLDANDDKGTSGRDFAVTFTEGDPATLIEDPGDATVTDVDNTTLASLTVTITNVLDPGFEALSADVTGTSITANYVSATGVLTLTGPDTVANFQTVLRKVKYQNTDNAPATTPRVILFVANDGAVNSSTATSTVTIVAVDTPPTAVNDSATVVEDSGANAINVLANDTDPDSGPKSITSVTQPTNGTVVITGGGTGLTYQPNANYCNAPPGTTLDTFTYTLTPGGSSATVTVTVTCVDDAPGAVNDSATVTEDAAATAINVLANDTDVDGGPKSISSVTQPANGVVVITGGGTGLTYQPNANYCNSTPAKNLTSAVGDTFTYTLTPGSSSATVTVTVTCVDDNPVAVNDSATVTEDAAATAVNVLSNDTDVDGGPKSIASVTQPTNGTVVITGGGTGLTYAPNANYCNNPPGTTLDTFTYTLTPGGSSATVSMTVTCVDDAPVAVNDTATTSQNAAALTVNVLANDTDIDGGPKSIASVTQPTNGTVVITNGGADLTYQPNANYCNVPPGTTLDTFTYTLTPGGSSATVSVTVNCDAPPVAVNDSATVTEDAAATAVNVLSNDTDVDGGPKSIASVTQPANGSVVITGGGTGLTYAPNANYCNNPPGTTLDTFTYTLNGGSTGTVSVTVTCVDDNPVAVNDSATVTEDAAATAINVLSNDTDVDGGPKSISSVTQPANGVVVITGGGTGLTYAPNANYCNSTPAKTLTPPPTGDTFTYTLTPGGSSATVTVTVTCVDDNPVAVNDSATVTEDAAATAINVLSNDTDVDGGPKSITSVTQPTNGTVVITGGGTGLTYAPNANYCNAPPGTTLDTFTYTLTPGGSSATVSVTVTCVDDPPVAVADSATILEDAGATAIPVLTNDTDVDGGPKSITSVTQPANGVVVITGGGTGLTYNPNANYCNNPPGTTLETFSYTLTPGSSSATVTVTVTCVNDPPTLANNPITYTTPGNTQLHVAGATLPGVASVSDSQSTLTKASPSDIDSPGPLTVVVASGTSANGGSFSIASDGSFTYVPPVGFTGADSFTYQVTDNDSPAATTTGTVNVTVGQRVWYIRDVVDANNAAGGDGRSTNAFDSIAAFNAATTNNGDIVYIFEGNTGTTPLTGGLTLKDGQKLWGQGIALTLSGFGTLVNATNKPRLRSTASNTPVVSVPATAGNRNNVEIRGLDLETTGASSNAIDVTSSGANIVGITISGNTVRGATGKGVNLSDGSTGAFTATLDTNSLTATGNAFDARTTAGTLTLSLSNTTVNSGATGINVDGSGGGTTWITGFANNAVSQNNVGTGISITSAKFDATPGGGYQQVSGGTTTIGASGNGVGGAGMILSTVSGDLAFTDLDIFADNGAALRVTGTGAVNVGAGTGTQVTVGVGVAIFEATGGPAVDITNATIDLQTTSIKSAGSSTTGVSLDTVMGTFSAGSGSQIQNATGIDFNINAGNAAVTYNGTISDTTGRLVSVTNTTGGTKSFTGTISDTGSGTGQGIFLNSNTGATINFSGALTLSTGSNGAFTATGGGTVTTTDTTSTIATTTGIALNVANTTIGSGGLKFTSIAAGTAAIGPANGIVLNNTGSSGGLTVSGTGSAGSGGTIQKTTGAGIALTSTRDVNLSYMVVKNSASDGISGSSVTNFSLANSSVINNGDATTERGVEFTNLLGTASVTNSSITGNAEDNLYVTNSSGTLTLLTVTGSTFSDTSTSIGNDGILFQGTGTAIMAISVSGSTFTNNRGDHFQATTDADTANTAQVDVVFQNNTLNTTVAGMLGGGITLNPSGAHKLTFDVLNNNIQKAVVSAITVNLGTASTAAARLEGTISGNTIGTAATAGSGSSTGNGMDLVTNGAGTTTVAVTGNNIYQWTNLYGLSLIARDNSSGNGRLNATITGNTLSNPNVPSGLPAEAIFLNAGPISTDNHQVCLDLGGAGALANSFAGAGNSAGGYNDFRLRQRASTTVRLPGYGGAATDTAAVVSYIQARNNGSETGSATVNSPPGGGFVGGAACPQPSLAAKRVADAVSAVQSARPDDAPATEASAATLDASAPTASAASAQVTTTAATDASPTKTEAPSAAVNVNVGVLPAGKSVTVVFDAVITATPSVISNQGSVSGSNFSPLLTDDPDTPTPSDPTVTRVYLAVKPAVWRSGTWYLRNSLSDGPAQTVFMYGAATDVPLMCDWDGDGVKTPGVFRKGSWYLRNSNTTGGADIILTYGAPDDTPVCGDWNGDSIETVGVVRGNTWFLRNSNTTGPADLAFTYGVAGDIPVVGDWDGNSTDTPGILRGGTWYLRNSNSTGPSNLAFTYGIPPGDRPIVGDWDGNGTDTVGVLRGNLWYLRNANSTGSADLIFQYGAPGDIALVWR